MLGAVVGSALMLLVTALLSVPAGQNKPEPDAAESCEFSDPKTYVCKLKADLKFSSGDPLTAEDVKFTTDKMLDPAVNSARGRQFTLISVNAKRQDAAARERQAGFAWPEDAFPAWSFALETV